jgi:hypothetical protein
MTSSQTIKFCPKCKKEKLLEEFYKNRARADGYNSHCKCCAKFYEQSPKGKFARKKYLNSPKGKFANKKYRNSSKGKLTVKKCNNSEAGKLAHRRYNNSEAGKLAQKKHNNSPKRKRYLANYEKLPKRKLTRKKYKKSEAGKLSNKKYQNSLKGKLAQKKYQKSPKGRLTRRKYYKTPEGKAKINWDIHRRRTLKANANATIGFVDEAKIYDRCHNKCVYCGETENLSIDHVEAISTGGPHVESNIVIACRSCNSSKGTKPVEEWLAIL